MGWRTFFDKLRLAFQNFDGQFDQGTNLDPARADIRIHNSGTAFPTFYWNNGLAISASLWEATKVKAPEWVIVSLQDEDGNLIPFGQAVTYGGYSVPNTQPGFEFRESFQNYSEEPSSPDKPQQSPS